MIRSKFFVIKRWKMKNNKLFNSIVIAGLLATFATGCSKILDKQPVTSAVTPTDTSGSITATDAENLTAGLYTYYRGYDLMEFSIFDRITNGDAIADNAYAGGDNAANITLDNFTANSLNSNMNRDWNYAYQLIGRVNINLPQIEESTDPALTSTRKNEMLGEARFLRAYTYFDLVRLFGEVPIILEAPDLSTSETLLNSTFVPRSSVDSVYMAILNDLWFALTNVRDVGATTSKLIITEGVVNAALAKVYASMPTPNWDSVLYYSDQVIPNYSLLPDYSHLWDNQHENNSEAIWALTYEGYSGTDGIGNWIPSIHVGGSAGNYEGGGWKKFNLPSNSLVELFNSEGDSIRLNNSITFLDISGQFTDPNWPSTRYPFLTKYNDPAEGRNDFYMIRLPDIMLLKAEALVQKGDIPGALDIVNTIRARVKLEPKTAATAEEANDIIADERRMELAFEGHRWFDLLRTGKALEVMNAETGGSGNNLNYNVQPHRLLMPVPQNQIDLNPRLTQNPGY
jgi:starch-binding outer membrane protein, SusD/RagB family